MHNNDPRRC